MACEVLGPTEDEYHFDGLVHVSEGGDRVQTPEELVGVVGIDRQDRVPVLRQVVGDEMRWLRRRRVRAQHGDRPGGTKDALEVGFVRDDAHDDSHRGVGDRRTRWRRFGIDREYRSRPER